MAEALYRKYRPQVFGDVVGQEHIERTIRNAIEHDKVSHAYLFTGPRGTGKTTTARLLAKALMCEKGPTPEPDGTCQDCQDIANGTHPDVYELDAASRTGVDNVREEIIGRVQFAPTRGRYKVYIIDEVHMLSTAAFNALLKTLEEPPSHVVFILCTTDPQKVPETIHSRCQRFDFHRISNDDIVARLGAVCGEEGVEFDPEALELIAYRAEGGMRNALTSLEQLIAFGGDKVTLETAERMLGSMDSDDLSGLIDALATCDAATCFNLTSGLVEDGTDLAQYVRDLAEYVRDLYLMSLAGVEVDLGITKDRRTAMEAQVKRFGPDRLSNLLCVLGDLSKELRSSANPRLSFEIALTRMVRPESDLTLSALAQRVEQLERALASGAGVVPVAGAAASGAGVTVPTAGQTSVPVSQASQSAQRPSRQMSSQGVPAFSAPAAQVPVSARGGSQSVAAPAWPSDSRGQQASRPASGVSSNPMPVTAGPAVSVPLRGSVSSAPAPRQAAAAPRPQVARPAAAATPSAQAPAATPVSSVAAPASSVAPADVDVSNPANLQRLWRAVTTTLRKSNPARGVLFLNAKVSASDAGVVRVGFSSENAFAFNAASKPEVVQLLAQTIEQVAGGSVPFELVMLDSAGAPTGMPRGASAQVPPARRPAPAAAPASVPVGAASMSPANAPIAPNGAGFRASSTPDSGSEAFAPRKPQAPSRPAGAPASVPAPGQAAQYQSNPRSAAQQSAPMSSSAPIPAQAPASGSYGREDDVPLDVYDSFASSYDDSGYDDMPPISTPAPSPAPAPVAGSAAPRPQAGATQARPSAPMTGVGSALTQAQARPAQPTAQPTRPCQPGQTTQPQVAAQPAQSARPGQPPAQSGQPADAPGMDEMEQMFNEAFGGDIRFTDLD